MTRSTIVNTVARRIVGQTNITYEASGAGGDDTENNLIELCGDCHVKAHSGVISKEELLKIVKKRK